MELIPCPAKQGISSRFLAWIKSLDTTVGAKALGPDQTVSGKVQSTVNAATQHAKSVDEQKGYTKVATDVRLSFFVLLESVGLTFGIQSTTPRPFLRHLARKSAIFTPPRPSRCLIFTRRPVVSLQHRQATLLPPQERLQSLQLNLLPLLLLSDLYIIYEGNTDCR